MSDADTKPCYVGVKPCGCAVAAIVISAEDKTIQNARQMGKEIASWVRDGLTVQTQDVTWVRANLKSCPHAKPSKRGAA